MELLFAGWTEVERGTKICKCMWSHHNHQKGRNPCPPYPVRGPQIAERIKVDLFFFFFLICSAVLRSSLFAFFRSWFSGLGCLLFNWRAASISKSHLFSLFNVFWWKRLAARSCQIKLFSGFCFLLSKYLVNDWFINLI
jgi:hypothetical protein